MSSRLSGRPACLFAVAVVFALISSLFTAAPAHAGTGSITGKVTKPSGSAVSNAAVELYSIADDDIYYEQSVRTRSDGTYTFASLDRGQYIVGFGTQSGTYATEFWNNKALIQDAAPISVGTSRVSSINARLEVGGKVSGRVLSEAPNSHSVADAEVAAYRYDDGEWTFGKSVLTSPDGAFTVGGLSDGQWTLEFSPPFDGPDADLALEYWENSRTIDPDDTFLVKPGMTVTGKDAHMSPGGRISGRVTGPNGEPVVDAFVFGYPSDNEGEWGNIAFTDENGNYVMRGLSAGQHRLEFVDGLEFDPFGEGPSYASEWWDDQSSFRGADRIDVVVGETTTGKNARLELASTPLVNTTPPTITGTPKVGETLTADPGAWTPHVSDGTFEYQWFDGDTAIAGADTKTFVPNADQLGRSISVQVTATRSYNSTSAMSDPTAPVATGVLTASRPVSLAPAQPRVGDQLVITPAEYGVESSSTTELLADGVPFTYSANEGVPAEVLGKKLSVRQVTTAAGYEIATTTSDETAAVQMGEFDPATTARIDGVPIVGEPLTTQLVNEVPGADYGYQWLAAGAEISGADQPTYTPKSDDIGKSLSVRLDMSKTGYNPAQSTSASTDPVVEAGTLPITQGTDAPSISGSPRVGSTLTANAGDWKPTPSSFAYQWLADGVAIDGAISSTFKPTATEGGKRISVKVTASRSGYASGTATSAETAQVVTSTPFGAPQGLAATKTAVTYIDLAWTKVDGAAGYRIYSGIGSGTRTKLEVGNVTSARIKGLKPSTTYSIDIAALKSDGTRSSYSPRINVKTMPLVPPSDLQVTAQTSTSLTLTWTKVAGVSKYRLYYGIGSGTRTRVDLGNVGTTTITGLKPGTTYSIDIASVLSDGTRSAYTPRVDGTTTN